MLAIKHLFYIILSLILFQSCAELQNLANVQKPSISVDDFRITGLSLQDIELTFDLEVDNPNPVSLSLSSYNYDLQIEENSFVKGAQSLNSTIQASGKNIVSIPVSFTFKELYNTFGSIKDKDNTDYQFLANIGVNVPVLGLIEIPIEKKGTLPVVKAPSISVSSLSVKNLSLTKADVELALNVDNPNAFGLILNKLDYQVDVNGFSPISGTSNERIEIGEKEKGTIKIPASFNLVDLGLGAYQALRGNQPFDYSIKGGADVGATLPFFSTSSFNFDKSGVLDLIK